MPFAEHHPAPANPALDWSARLDQREPPTDRMFWIVTDQGRACEVAYDREATFWLPAESGPFFTRQDGEPGCYGADELIGWSDSQRDAEEAAELYLRAG